ncbi:hypothetical protein AAMO2058_000557700 [Amorphochlora amoebiformis]
MGGGPRQEWVISDSLKIVCVSVQMALTSVFMQLPANSHSRRRIQKMHFLACLLGLPYLFIRHGLIWDLRNWQASATFQFSLTAVLACEGVCCAFMVSKNLFRITPPGMRVNSTPYVVLAVFTILTQVANIIVVCAIDSILVAEIILYVGEYAILLLVSFILTRRTYGLLRYVAKVEQNSRGDSGEVSDSELGAAYVPPEDPDTTIRDRALTIDSNTIAATTSSPVVDVLQQQKQKIKRLAYISAWAALMLIATMFINTVTYTVQGRKFVKYSAYYEKCLRTYIFAEDIFSWSVIALMFSFLAMSYERDRNLNRMWVNSAISLGYRPEGRLLSSLSQYSVAAFETKINLGADTKPF